MIGINSAMRSDAQGIAFALNADMVQQVLSQHLSAGKMAHVTHGLTCHEVVKDEDGEDRVQVVVDEVAAKGPAAAAGLKRGDVVVKVGGPKVSNRFDLERALWDCKCGDEVSVLLRRDDKTLVKANLTLTRGNGERVTAAATASEVAWDMDKVGTPVSTQK